ncbi:MAG: hypothetical protein MK102_14775 [Fuerstiella sp.]|nr:hypothetical protein [Fuerstiella sp.]
MRRLFPSAAEAVKLHSFSIVGLITVTINVGTPLEISAEEFSVETNHDGRLQSMLRIRWEPGSNLPQDFQDRNCGIIDRHLITAGGFCSGGLKAGRTPFGIHNK